jgi:hypothetical protein
MTDVSATPFAALDANGSLLKPQLKADTEVAGRFGYRGDIAYDGPETFIKEVFAVSEEGKPAISFLAGSIKELQSIPKIVEHFGPSLDTNGKYMLYVSDAPRGARWYIPVNGIPFFIVFIDDTSVYNELIDIFYVDKVKLKKYSTTQKLDALADVGVKFDKIEDYEAITWEEALKRQAAG